MCARVTRPHARVHTLACIPVPLSDGVPQIFWHTATFGLRRRFAQAPFKRFSFGGGLPSSLSNSCAPATVVEEYQRVLGPRTIVRSTQVGEKPCGQVKPLSCRLRRQLRLPCLVAPACLCQAAAGRGPWQAASASRTPCEFARVKGVFLSVQEGFIPSPQPLSTVPVSTCTPRLTPQERPPELCRAGRLPLQSSQMCSRHKHRSASSDVDVITFAFALFQRLHPPRDSARAPPHKSLDQLTQLFVPSSRRLLCRARMFLQPR